MYTAVMQGTQTYFDAEEVSALDAVDIRTGASRSELIRRAIRVQYGDRPQASRALAASAPLPGPGQAGSTRARSSSTRSGATSTTDRPGSVRGEAPRHDHRHRPPPGRPPRTTELLERLTSEGELLLASELSRFELLAGMRPDKGDPSALFMGALAWVPVDEGTPKWPVHWPQHTGGRTVKSMPSTT